MADVGVDLPSFESLLQVVVDGLVGNLAEQRQVRDTDFLLFGCLEGGLLGFCGGCCIARGLVLGTSCDTLLDS